MKLIHTHVTNFRCIVDSNTVEIGETTCLVGKNEAGKTAFLKALEGLRSMNEEYKRYNKTEEYPRRYLSNYDQKHGGSDAQVIETVWSLDESDKKCLGDEFGAEAINGNQLRITKRYGTNGTTWDVPINQAMVLEKLIARFDLSEDEAAPIRGIDQTDVAAKRLSEVAEPTEAQSATLAAITKFPDADAARRAIDLLNVRTPQFLYFSHYDRMSGEISVNQLNQDKAQGQISDGDQVFLDFLEYAGTKLEELTEATRFEEMNAKCEAAANHITDQMKASQKTSRPSTPDQSLEHASRTTSIV